MAWAAESAEGRCRRQREDESAAGGEEDFRWQWDPGWQRGEGARTCAASSSSTSSCGSSSLRPGDAVAVLFAAIVLLPQLTAAHPPAPEEFQIILDTNEQGGTGTHAQKSVSYVFPT